MKKSFLILLVIALSGCGQRGPLFLPEQEQTHSPDTPAEVVQPEAERAQAEDIDAQETKQP
ncbi:MAG: lipoprotein [Aestuariibacter sp.]